MQLPDLVHYLDTYLRIAAVPDSARALNGLQVANGGEVTRIAAAVDLCRTTIERASAARADLLLVHHGMFWSGLGPLVGRAYERTALLLRNNVALYSAHLPLDVHPEVGNNPVLARALGIESRGSFGMHDGLAIGVWGDLHIELASLSARLETLLGATPRVLAFGPARVSRVGILTGAGAPFITEAAAAGLDTFVTGEGPHHSFFDAEEQGINVVYAGHYATETVGVKALAEHLSRRFQLPWTFIDHPTGL